MERVLWVKQSLNATFQKNRLGEAGARLGLDFIRHQLRQTLHLTQTRFTEVIFDIFGMNSDQVTTSMKNARYREERLNDNDNALNEPDGYVPYWRYIGSLMYLMSCTMVKPEVVRKIQRTQEWYLCF